MDLPEKMKLLKRTALLQELVDTVNDPEFGNDHTGVVNWVLKFAEDVREELEKDNYSPVD